MKIVFDRDLKGRKIKQGVDYSVIEKNGGTYLILNDDKYPVLIWMLDGKINLIDGEIFLNGRMKIDGRVIEIESEIAPLLTGGLKSLYSPHINDLFEYRCWAVTEFTFKLFNGGIDVCDEFKQIAFNDISKITYVQAEMSALFLSLCNFFSNCSDDQFRFAFDKHNKENIGLLELANVSFNHHLYGSNEVEFLDEIEDWSNALKDKLYYVLTVNSDFGRHIEKHGLQEDIENDRACLMRAITRIVNAVQAIFYAMPVRVHQVPLNGFPESLKGFGQFCLIFETENIYYRFYLGNFD